MDIYSSYKQARDAAWKVLIECRVDALPIDLGRIAAHYGLHMLIYSRCAITQLFDQSSISDDGFITSLDGVSFIFINDRIKSRGRRRYTLGHEIGHAIMGHPLDVIHTRNSESDPPDNVPEMQANVFARDLLMPACVLHELGVTTTEEIMRLCDISLQSAKIRLERLRLLDGRNAYGTSPLERQVLHQFRPWIVGQK